MIAFSSARIGTSDAAKRVDARALAFQRHRAEAARHLAEADRDRAQADDGLIEPVAEVEPGNTARQWAERQMAIWAERQPHIVVRIKPRWRIIVEEVAAPHGVTVEDVLGPSRSRPLVRPRQEAMYRVYDETSLSLLEIGRRFNRDHTTVLHAVQAHAARHGLPLPRQDEEQPS